MVALLQHLPKLILLLHPQIYIMTGLKLDQWGSRWSFARGATKATQKTNGRAITELTDALAEVDGLLAGINYLEKSEPESEEPPSLSGTRGSATNSSTFKPAEGPWLRHLNMDLPQLNPSSSEEQPTIETRHIRNYLNGKLTTSNENSGQKPRESQWATLRSLREASTYHYHQFTKVTADSTSPDIRKLRKSYVTAKNMLEMGILTFRAVLHGQIPTTLAEIFAFASLSYVISKTLHAKGHLDESDILSGLWDWRAAITDERERLALDEIAKQLWPEAKQILHFIPLERTEMGPGTAGLRQGNREMRFPPLPRLQETMDLVTSMPTGENLASRDEPSLSLPLVDEYTPISQASTFPLPPLGQVEGEQDGLQHYVRQILHETMSYDDFMFSHFLTLPEEFMGPSWYPTTPPNISPHDLSQSPLQTGYSIDTPSVLSESPSSPHPQPSPVEPMDAPAGDAPLSRLVDTPLFQAVFQFVIRECSLPSC